MIRDGFSEDAPGRSAGGHLERDEVAVTRDLVEADATHPTHLCVDPRVVVAEEADARARPRQELGEARCLADGEDRLAPPDVLEPDARGRVVGQHDVEPRVRRELRVRAEYAAATRRRAAARGLSLSGSRATTLRRFLGSMTPAAPSPRLVLSALPKVRLANLGCELGVDVPEALTKDAQLDALLPSLSPLGDLVVGARTAPSAALVLDDRARDRTKPLSPARARDSVGR